MGWFRFLDNDDINNNDIKIIIMGMNESDSGTEMMGVWFRVCLCYLETQRKVHFVESGNSDFLFKECKEKKWN